MVGGKKGYNRCVKMANFLCFRSKAEKENETETSPRSNRRYNNMSLSTPIIMVGVF